MLKLNIQMFADGKVVIDTELNTKNFENGLDKIKGTTQKAGSTIKNIVAGLGITKLISVAMNQITGSIDGAVSRLDTLNNFPKVMSNLGISAEESQKAISKMSDKLAGLPTTLDDGARAVQRFTSKNGNVKKSTDLFLALNNAILAGGASSEIQASALEQLSQAYAKGKPDMMEWRTAMTAMPAQLKQVAEAMGYIDADQLGEALRNGTVSMDEFMDTITKLNKEGINGFQSFEKQARNSTDGIRTALTVAKTQVVKGVADIINAFNVRLEETGFGNIPTLISEIGKKSKEALDVIADLIGGQTTVEQFGNLASNLITKFINTINDGLPSIVSKGADIINNFIIGFSQNLPSVMTAVTELIFTIYDTIIDNSDKIFDAGAELLVKFAEGIEKNLPVIAEKSTKMIDTISQKLTEPESVKKMSEAGTKIIILLAMGLIKALPNIIKTAQQINGGIINPFSKTPSEMFNIGVNIIKGVWNGFKSQLANIKNNIVNAVDGIVSSVKKKLKIFSPSHVFRDEIGAMMAEGIGVGFNDSIKDVYDEMQKAIDLETSQMEANVQSNGTYQMAMAEMPTFNLQDNSTNTIELIADGRKLAEVVNTQNRNREVARA